MLQILRFPIILESDFQVVIEKRILDTGHTCSRRLQYLKNSMSFFSASKEICASGET